MGESRIIQTKRLFTAEPITGTGTASAFLHLNEVGHVPTGTAPTLMSRAVQVDSGNRQVKINVLGSMDGTTYLQDTEITADWASDHANTDAWFWDILTLARKYPFLKITLLGITNTKITMDMWIAF